MHRVSKLVTVFGTTFRENVRETKIKQWYFILFCPSNLPLPWSPMTILPAVWLSISISKYTLDVISAWGLTSKSNERIIHMSSGVTQKEYSSKEDWPTIYIFTIDSPGPSLISWSTSSSSSSFEYDMAEFTATYAPTTAAAVPTCQSSWEDFFLFGGDDEKYRRPKPWYRVLPADDRTDVLNMVRMLRREFAYRSSSENWMVLCN